MSRGQTPVGVAIGAERLQWPVADLLAHGWTGDGRDREVMESPGQSLTPPRG
jgi:hypothetical protein